MIASPAVGRHFCMTLSEIGDDRALFSDAQGLQCLVGTAPVSYQSGQIHRVYLLLGGFAAQMLKCVLRFWTPHWRANPPKVA